MSLQDAIAADRSGDIRAAADSYEQLLATGEVSLDVLLNLALLYWQATDAGFGAAKKFGHDFFADASRRIPSLLAEAQRRFPHSAEPRFWKRYIDWADLGLPFPEEDCRDLLREDPTSLGAAMYLIGGKSGPEGEHEAREVLRRCRDDGTARARYVASVVEGVLRRSSRR